MSNLTSKPRKKALTGWSYAHAAIIADMFCNPSEAPDMHPHERDIIEQGFKDACALTGVPIPAFAENPKAWRRVRQSYIDMRRAAESMFEAAQTGSYSSILHHDSLHYVSPYTLTGRAAQVAEWLSFVLHAFWFAADRQQSVNPQSLRERLDKLQQAIEWNGWIERYGVEAVKQAKDAREKTEAQAIDAARDSIPSLRELLTDLPALDTEQAMQAELGDDWQRFIAEIEKGGASR